jgi:hypothetical protein
MRQVLTSPVADNPHRDVIEHHKALLAIFDTGGLATCR